MSNPDGGDWGGRKLLPFVFLLVFIGAVRLEQTLDKPQMQSSRGVDVVSLTGAGFAFGTAFGLLILGFGPAGRTFRRERGEKPSRLKREQKR